MSVDISLQLRAPHAIVDHFDKTGERLSDADLAIELRVTMTRVREIRDEVKAGEDGWY